MSERKPFFTARTTKMPDDMYKHVIRKSEAFGSFRDYAFHLFEQDMEANNSDEETTKALNQMKEFMVAEFKKINNKIDAKSFVEPGDQIAYSKEEDREKYEGQVTTQSYTGGQVMDDEEVTDYSDF